MPLVSSAPNFRPTSWLPLEDEVVSTETVAICTNDTCAPEHGMINGSHLPIDMTFNDGHVLAIVGYSILLVVSATGNLSVLASLLRRRHRSNPHITLMLIHLAIADLLVTLLLMPLEIGWAITVSWKAGDIACRIMSFFRTFGLYLSSFVMMCISIDRYGAILHPLNMSQWKMYGRRMLRAAWLASFIFSLPQAFIFHLESHPQFPWYEQCITFNSYPTRNHEIFYVAFGMVFMYALPLGIFAFTYGSIIYEIAQRNRQEEGSNENGIRRLTGVTLGRARIKTVKMTITIVGVFVFCWTPYNVMSIWHLSDPESAQHLDQKIQKGLFIFAVANSSFNPIVYGIFSRRRTRKARKLQRCKVPYEIKTQQSFKRGLHLTKSEYDGNDIELKAVIHKENGTCYTSIKRLNAPASAIPT